MNGFVMDQRAEGHVVYRGTNRGEALIILQGTNFAASNSASFAACVFLH